MCCYFTDCEESPVRVIPKGGTWQLGNETYRARYVSATGTQSRDKGRKGHRGSGERVSVLTRF